MNRINTIIDFYATAAAVAFYKAVACGRDGFIEEAADFTDKMLDAREQLKMWMKISHAIRGWKL